MFLRRWYVKRQNKSGARFTISFCQVVVAQNRDHVILCVEVASMLENYT